MAEAVEKFEMWAIVELMGHARIAGLISEKNIAGTNMLRVDVPDTTAQPAFTRFLGGTAIYAINPVTEDVAKTVAESLKTAPVNAYSVSRAMEKMKALQEGEEEEPESDKFYRGDNDWSEGD